MRLLLSLVLCAGALSAQDAPDVNQDSVSASEANLASLTLKARSEVMFRKFVSPAAALETIPGTISDHARNFPEEWTRSPAGFGKRFASQYGQFVLGETIEFYVSALRHEEPRYIYSQDRSIWGRTRHAIVTTYVTERTGHEGRSIYLGRIAGVYGSWAIATRWAPEGLQSPGSIMLWGSVGLASKAGSNVFREFWPDIRRRIHHH